MFGFVLCNLTCTCEKDVKVDAERVRNSLENFECRVSAASFHSAHVRTIQARTRCQLVLAEPQEQPVLADGCAEVAGQVHVGYATRILSGVYGL